MIRKKTSLTLDDQIWLKFQQYALSKYGNSRNANTELEIAMRDHMKNNPLEKITTQLKRSRSQR